MDIKGEVVRGIGHKSIQWMQIHIYCRCGFNINPRENDHTLHPSTDLRSIPEVSCHWDWSCRHARRMAAFKTEDAYLRAWPSHLWELKATRRVMTDAEGGFYLHKWPFPIWMNVYRTQNNLKNSNESYISLQTITDVLCVCKLQTAASWRHAKLTGLNNSQLLATFCFSKSQFNYFYVYLFTSLLTVKPN